MTFHGDPYYSDNVVERGVGISGRGRWEMKGRRKAKTDKWLLMAQFAKDARLILVYTASATTRLYPPLLRRRLRNPSDYLQEAERDCRSPLQVHANGKVASRWTVA